MRGEFERSFVGVTGEVGAVPEGDVARGRPSAASPSPIGLTLRSVLPSEAGMALKLACCHRSARAWARAARVRVWISEPGYDLSPAPLEQGLQSGIFMSIHTGPEASDPAHVMSFLAALF